MAKFAFLAVIAAFATLLPVHLVAGDSIGKELGHWSFDGTLEDISSHQLGPAIPAWDPSPVGDIELAWEDAKVDTCRGYLKIGKPGYLKLPRVDFRDKSFTFSLSLRLHGISSKDRVLYTDWRYGTVSFNSYIVPDRRIYVSLRNGQGKAFVYMFSGSPVPLKVWVDVAFTWDRNLRTASIFIDRKLDRQKKVSSEIQDIDLFPTSTPYYCLGSYVNTAIDDEPLHADVRDLRVFEGLAPNLPSHLPQVIEQ